MALGTLNRRILNADEWADTPSSYRLTLAAQRRGYVGEVLFNPSYGYAYISPERDEISLGASLPTARRVIASWPRL